LALGDVLWNSPAFKAGLASGMTVVAINGLAPSKETLTHAVLDAQKTRQPIVLMVSSLDHIDSVSIDYHDGLKYPHLQRIPGTPDRLTQIMTARK
jgi:predicted metalloprotease with PDZ domain